MTNLTWTCTAFRGADYTSNPEALAPAANKPGDVWLTKAENWRFNREGSVATRLGFEQKIDLGSGAKVNSLGAHENAMFAKSGTKIYYSTDDWLTSTETTAVQTSTTRDFFFPRRNEMFVVNATDGLKRMDSAYAVTSISGELGTCISELDGSMLVAVGDVIDFSAAFTEANPEFFYDFAANGAGSKKMTSTVNTMLNAAAITLIGMEQGIDYAYAFDTDTGALLTKTLTRSHRTVNPWSIAYIENNTFAIFTGRRILLCISDANGVRIIDDPFRPKNAFDYPVRKILEDLPTDQGLSFTHFNPTRREYSAYVIKDDSPTGLICNIDIGSWSVDTGKPFSSMVNWEGRVYAGDDSDDKIYLDNEGAIDNTFAIAHRLVFPFFHSGGATNDYLGLRYSGLLNATGEYTQRFYVTGANGTETSEEVITADDLVTEGLMNVSSGVPIGAGVIGAEKIGSGGSTPNTFAFKYPWEDLRVGEKAQVEFEIFTDGTQMELRSLSVLGETDGEVEYDAQ